jgi:hydrogenase expression/formation protein HypE
MARLIEGKLPHDLLKRFLARAPRGAGVVVGPAVGEDAAVLQTGRGLLVASTDPITFTSEDLGHYAVNVNANDVAAMGARPRWFLADLLVPDGFDSRGVEAIFRSLADACVNLGVSLCGGHTEVTSAAARPIIVGTMLGTVSRAGLVRPLRAREGDVLLITKRLAIEGTAIIARKLGRVASRVLGKSAAARARSMLKDPGISIVPEAMTAVEKAPVHAMHDPTEGGFISGVWEICYVTGLGVLVDEESIPVYPATARMCRHLGLNPLGLIASGSLLIAASPRSAGRIAAAIRGKGIECTAIGRLAGRRPYLLRGGKRQPFPAPAVDEITRIQKAQKQGSGRKSLPF